VIKLSLMDAHGGWLATVRSPADAVAELTTNGGEGSSLYSLVPLPLSVFDAESAANSPPAADIWWRCCCRCWGRCWSLTKTTTEGRRAAVVNPKTPPPLSFASDVPVVPTCVTRQEINDHRNNHTDSWWHRTNNRCIRSLAVKTRCHIVKDCFT